MILLETIALVLFGAWVAGIIMQLSGDLINIFLVLSIILFLSEFFKARYR